MSASYDAIVVGAGPSGATAARLLAQAGWSVALVEKKEFPRRKVCGEFISATSLPLLTDSVISEAYLATAGPAIRRVGLFAGSTVLDSPMPEAGASGWGRALGREHLDLLLADAAARAGAQLFQPFKAAALTREGQLYSCTIANGDSARELTAPRVILAQGSWEKTGLLPEPPRPPKRSDLLAFKAHFIGSRLQPELMPLLVFPGGYGGMVASDHGRMSLSCCIRRDVLAAARHELPGETAGDAVLRHILRHCDGAAEVLSQAQRDGAWLAAGPIRPGMRPCSVDGLFAVGNKAGEAHPIIAEGISMAMQSSWLLCRRLLDAQDRQGSSDRETGRLYARDWRAAFATRIRAASVFAHLAMRKEAALAAPLLGRFPGIITWGAQLSGKAKQVVTAA